MNGASPIDPDTRNCPHEILRHLTEFLHANPQLSQWTQVRLWSFEVTAESVFSALLRAHERG